MTTVLASTLSAQSGSEVLAVFAPLASALSNGDGEAFMKPIDRQMPGYAQLRDNIMALLARFDVTSSIELNSANGDKVELDWYLELHSKQAAGPNERRSQIITARVVQKRIVSIEPVGFFAADAPTTKWRSVRRS